MSRAQSYPELSETLIHLTRIMQSMNAFYAPFEAADWNEAHGDKWVHADVPYHLYTFNQAALDGLGVAEGGRFFTTFKDYNGWNDQNFSLRPPETDGPAALALLTSSCDALVSAAGERGAAAAAHLPFIFNNGQRRLDWSLYYLTYHKWFHLLEAHLRKHNRPPELPPDTLKYVFGHQLLMMPEVLTAKALDGHDMRVTLNITPVGSWTITVADNQASVAEGAVDDPDTSFTVDYVTYMKANFFRMQNPMLAMLFGKMKVKGLSKAGNFQKLYAVWPEREWRTHELGRPE
jgi:hypothetical protein